MTSSFQSRGSQPAACLQTRWRTASLLVLIGFLSLATSCSKEDNAVGPPTVPTPAKSIVILYENDVHCAIDGYTRMAGLRDAIVKADTAYVGVVSVGDFLNGGVSGVLNQGQYIVDIMRSVGYDAVTLGNHEFDFGMPRVQQLMPLIQAPVVCANLYQAGADRPMYPTFIMKQYGQKRIGFVGVCTAESMRTESYAFYDKQGNMLYDLCPQTMTALVQQSVDSAYAAGADYVVLLSHLGELTVANGVNSHDMVSQTHGIDMVLDGHTHTVVPHAEQANQEGRPIGITQTGTQFANIGKLVITPDGRFLTELIPMKDVEGMESARVTATTDSVKTLMEGLTSAVVGQCDFELTVNDASGNRVASKAETNLGDLVSDAFRARMQADIGLENGGGLRSSIPAGDITFGDVIGAVPFFNVMCKIEVTGEMLLNMLSQCTARFPAKESIFPHVSGMKYTIHSVSHTISDVLVLNRQTNDYEPLDMQAKYTVACTDYYRSGGFYRTLVNADLLEQTSETQYETLAWFIREQLHKRVGDEYRYSQGRVTVVE